MEPHASVEHTVSSAAYQAGCAGKDQYASESAADAVLILSKQGRLYDHGRSLTWGELHSYRCSFCGFVHIGHSA
jgi:hypothetical protein